MSIDTGVTVVVPTVNRGGFLPDCLADLVEQRHRPLEILVVDQSDRDDPVVAALAACLPDLISYHRVTFRGLPIARNYGWQAARHEAIVFVDDDIRCGPDLAGEHLRALSRPGVGLVAGGVDAPRGEPDRRRRAGVYRAWTGTPLRGFASTAGHDTDHGAGCNFSSWRSALEAAGGFDEALGTGAALYEETDLCLRVKCAGYRVYFEGAARLTHLTAAAGGCRVDRVPDYVRSLAHNRAAMARRHGRWYQTPVALARLAALGFSYARHYRSPAALPACAAGAARGWVRGASPPVCTAFGRGVPQ